MATRKRIADKAAKQEKTATKKTASKSSAEAHPKHPHQAAKKGAKKAAKKAAKKTAAPGGDVRRAYEHLGRLHILQGSLSAAFRSQVYTLFEFAQAALHGGDARSAADLLRAAEHFAFGSLAEQRTAQNLSEDLRRALKEEFAHRMERASSRWKEQDAKPPRELKIIYKQLREAAKSAWKQDQHTQALEFARGADALAHAAHGALRPEVARGTGLESEDEKASLTLELTTAD